nr:hypothetical protein [Nocardia bovistercoris]
MLWSAVNVQQNIAPSGPSDPLYWFSYLIEAMISVCLIIIMIGTNKVSEWGVNDNRGQVVAAEIALLALTVGLNTYPYVRGADWFDAGVHAVAPVMIGVALLIHDAASARYGLAITRATDQVRDLPDPAEVIRSRLPDLASYRPMAAELGTPQAVVIEAEPEPDYEPAVEYVEEEIEDEEAEVDESEALTEVLYAEDEEPEDEAPQPVVKAPKPVAQAPKPAVARSTNGTAAKAAESTPPAVKPAAVKPAPVTKPAAVAKPVTPPVKPAPPAPAKPVVAKAPAQPEPTAAPVVAKPAPPAEVAKPAVAAVAEPQPVQAVPAPAEKPAAKPAAAKTGIRKVVPGKGRTAADSRPAAKNGKETPAVPAKPDLQVVPAPDPIHDTGQFRIAELLEQELAELQAERRRARTSRQR